MAVVRVVAHDFACIGERVAADVFLWYTGIPLSSDEQTTQHMV